MEEEKPDRTSLLKLLAEKWQNRPCQMCNSGPLSVSNKTFEIREYHGGDMVVGGPIVPIVPVVCLNCGNTILVNAIVAGIVKSKPEKIDDKIEEKREDKQ
jgi:hypothetical protein